MTRFVTFNGQTQFKPGGLTSINANALTPIGLSASGIVALIGEAEGGEPNTVITVDDPALAEQLFRSGAIPDAIRIAFDPSNDPRIPGGAFRVLAYKTNQSTQAACQFPGDPVEVADTAAGGSTTTVITLTTGGLTPDAHIGRWLQLDTPGTRRRIVDNDASSITVSPGFDAAPVATDPLTILASQLVITSRDYGLHTNQVGIEIEAGVTSGTVITTVTFEDLVEQSPELGSDQFLRLKYVGGAIVDQGNVDSIDSTGLIVTVDLAAVPGLNAFAGQLLQFTDGTQREIASNTAADPSAITLIGGHALTTAQQTALVGTNAIIRDVTSATASIDGANGVATALTSVVAPVADNLAITFTPQQTLRSLVDQINATTNYEATIPDGVNGDTTLMSSFDFGTRATTQEVRFDENIGDGGSFLRDLQILVDWYNDFSELVTAAKSTVGTEEVSELPLVTGGVAGTVKDVPVFLIGGARGISANSNFQTGLDALLQVRANHVVPLIDQDLTNEGFSSTATFESVAAQLAAHVDAAAGVNKSERGGYLGYNADIDTWLAQAATLNNADIQLGAQGLTTLNAAGTLTAQPFWSIAVAAVGMRSGAPEVGEPITFKLIKTNALTQDTSWSPKSLTDINRILAGGGLFAEQVEGTGFRFVRDLTTWLADDNIAFIDGNTRDAVRFIAFDLRTTLENQFTGLKATPANVQAIRSTVVAKMGVYLEDNIIVESLDPETETQTIPGFRNLRVSITGNVASIKIEIFPVTGIVFELTEIFLQLPRLAA